MSQAPTVWDYVRRVTRALAEGAMVAIVVVLGGAAGGALLGFPIAHFVGIRYRVAFGVITASLVALLVIASIVLGRVAHWRYAARLRRLKCVTCGEYLAKHDGLAGGGGSRSRYRCSKCGAWTEATREF